MKLFLSCTAVLILVSSMLTLFLGLRSDGPGGMAVSLYQTFELTYKDYTRGYIPKNFPEKITRKDFEKCSRLDRDYGFIGKDFSGKDFSELSLEFLARQKFDSRTEWPSKVKSPERFLPEAWLETGKDPGLGLSELHRQGITGRGISIAVFDKYIIPDHREFTGRMVFHPLATDSAKVHNYRLHYHGISCASVLCGETCGVAPGATVHYFAVPDDARNTYNYCLAMDRLIEVNQGLSAEQKIRAVSISDMPHGNEKTMTMWREALDKAKANNVAVICSDYRTTHAVFTAGGCPPWLDRENPDNYHYANWATRDSLHAEKLILPSWYRALASNRGGSDYTWWGDGGFSWAIPYFAGLAALAWSVDRDLTIEEIYELARSTKSVSSRGRYVVNPRGLIDTVKEGRLKEVSLR
jgi:Subtilase family